MTTATTPVHSSLRRADLAALAASFGAASLTVLRRARQGFRAFAEAGQLGPDRNTEVGRWTGTRT